MKKRFYKAQNSRFSLLNTKEVPHRKRGKSLATANNFKSNSVGQLQAFGGQF